MIRYVPEVRLDQYALSWRALDSELTPSIFRTNSRKCDTWGEAINRLERYVGGVDRRIVLDFGYRVRKGANRIVVTLIN